MADTGMVELKAGGGLDSRDAASAKVAENVPLDRAEEPAERASIVSFQASETSSSTTGVTTAAEGGRTTWTSARSLSAHSGLAIDPKRAHVRSYPNGVR
ncbi:hypothetical protein [Paeniglutamicibacter cryotolerans]|uniref:NAD(P)-dependent dehydrogenase (Short-subunit alcohol dehydrogenase family) n=1 Tax=Paeniglutamicibacter cryotolerans TaxID=670079 RepID=A0A839QIS9_9MICC|nr:hypothetical protein [Paeniglutamicibacter cryotolerans]MBB2994445.1 NAD(P)-dependent dehydrogenase (short-subunit alcohol dehydrogenase family) [Paeniglutamicibacter cryotolerans]